MKYPAVEYKIELPYERQSGEPAARVIKVTRELVGEYQFESMANDVVDALRAFGQQ